MDQNYSTFSHLNDGHEDTPANMPNTTSTTPQPPPSAPYRKPPRRHDLDNLKTFLTVLVIFHHTAIVYGVPMGFGPFSSKYIPPKKYQNGHGLITMFLAINQSYFMGLFFGISGYFSAQALQKCTITATMSSNGRGRAVWRFVKGKMLRLGAPAVVFTLVFHPMVAVGEETRKGERSVGVWEIVRIYWREWMRLDGVKGPVWYTATLLVFDVFAAGVTYLRLRRGGRMEDGDNDGGDLRKAVVMMVWVLTIPASFFLRLVWPIGTFSPPLSLQLGYAPQYVFAYWLGHKVYHCQSGSFLHRLFNVDEDIKVDQDDEEDLENHIRRPKARSKFGRFLPSLSLRWAFPISFMTMPLVAVIPKLIHPSLSTIHSEGGWNMGALIYAIWNECSFALISPAMVRHFVRKYNYPSKAFIVRPRYAYAAFLDHLPLSIAVCMIIDDTLGPYIGEFIGDRKILVVVMPVVMTAVVGMLNTILSFVIGRWLVEYVPGVGKVI